MNAITEFFVLPLISITIVAFGVWIWLEVMKFRVYKRTKRSMYRLCYGTKYEVCAELRLLASQTGDLSLIPIAEQMEREPNVWGQR